VGMSAETSYHSGEGARQPMDYRVKGKRAFVTAGAHGIGEAIADLLTAEGATVIVADVDAAALGNRWGGTIAADLATAEGARRARVNAVLPGPVWTRMWTREGGIADQLAAHYGVDREAAVARFLEDRQLPMGIGQPEDVAHAVVFLASPLAKFITGASLDIG